jgi:glycine oxidase
MASNAEAARTADRSVDVADIIVIGDGVIGLSTTFELARAGARCVVIGDRRPGTASNAAAGLLAPSIGQLAAAVRPFFFGSLELYPGLIDRLRAFDPSLAMVQGLIDLSEPSVASPRNLPPRLTGDEIRALEPSLASGHGGSFHPGDGAIDNVALVGALRLALEAAPDVEIVLNDPAVRLDLSASEAVVVLRSGARRSARVVVLAAGAWSPQLDGLPRALPVSPLKGQMLAVASNGLRRAVMSAEVYLVPRRTELVIGATVEREGFDIATHPEMIEGLRQAAIRVCPALEHASVTRSWAGIRPATPDMLPIIGPEPSDPRLIYACGHSKNGILLAPATAIAVAALAQNGRPEADLAPFSVARFGAI